MNIDSSYNFRKLTELVSCSGSLKGLDWQSMLDNRYELIINLLPYHHKYSVANEKEAVEALGINYIFIPVDWQNPKNSELEDFVLAMANNKEKKMHIHCAANYRASAFYAIYAYKQLDWSKEKSYKLIASVWQLADYPIWQKFVANYIQK